MRLDQLWSVLVSPSAPRAAESVTVRSSRVQRRPRPARTLQRLCSGRELLGRRVANLARFASTSKASVLRRAASQSLRATDRFCLHQAPVARRRVAPGREATPPSQGRGGALSRTGGRPQPLLQVVADYERLSAALTAGRAGHGRASGPQYPGVSIGRATLQPGDAAGTACTARRAGWTISRRVAGVTGESAWTHPGATGGWSPPAWW
jgi:hypothetical protein